jgi:hypothetical protein
MAQLRDVHLSVEHGKIYINPDSLKVLESDVVRFIVDTPNTTFEIAIHNFDHYFTDTRTIIVDQASDTAPAIYTVNSSDNLVKYYSVCVINTSTPPKQPDAPPRIIRIPAAS